MAHMDIPLLFHAAILVVGTVAGFVASIAGFGIGSLLTPALGIHVSTKTAVAAISIPHVVGTAVRFWTLRHRVDRRVLLTFGVTSAAGGLVGALLHERARGASLSIVFGLLLLFVAASELSGLSRRLRFHGPMAWVAGAASGLLGGLVGNQGGIRSAALLGMDLQRQSFVATATAVGLAVDAARMPVYMVTTGSAIAAIWPLVAVATAGVLAGTFLGTRALLRMPERTFRTSLAFLLAALGAAMLVSGLA
jgi:uncharacterized membrane protein YfcA